MIYAVAVLAQAVVRFAFFCFLFLLLFCLLFLLIMASSSSSASLRVAEAEALHLAARANVVRIETELKKARAVAAETGSALAREQALATREIIKDDPASPPVPGRKVVAKHHLKAAAVRAVRGSAGPVRVGGRSGRPADVPAPESSRLGRPLAVPGECGQCRHLRRRSAGEVTGGGHAHATWCHLYKPPKARVSS